MPEIVTKTIRCTGGLPAFLAVPAGGGKRPAIVLMHERYGLVKHTCDLAERLARDGSVCIAPDFYYQHPVRMPCTAATSGIRSRTPKRSRISTPRSLSSLRSRR